MLKMKVNKENSAFRHGGSRVRARRLAYEVYKIPKKCEVTGEADRIEIHHIDENPQNQEKENLMILRKDLHSRVSAFNRYVPLKDKKEIKRYLSCFTQKEPALIMNEIYPAIVGESTLMGEPCVIVRLTYCHNLCSYCDSKYTWHEGKMMTISDILKEIKQHPSKLIMITGGSPLLQKKNLKELINLILKSDKEYRIMVEASGTLHINPLKLARITIIKDIKCPSSHCKMENVYSDIKLLRPRDNLKLVINDRNDYNFAKLVLAKYPTKAMILLQPVHGKLDLKKLTKWFLEDEKELPKNIRIGFQMHKYVWGDERGK